MLAGDETHLNLLPHVRASWTPRAARPQIPTPGANRQVTVFDAIEVTTGHWRAFAIMKHLGQGPRSGNHMRHRRLIRLAFRAPK